jgi:DNA-binding MarR family transcriptional regulator
MGTSDQPLWRQAADRTLHVSVILKTDLEERLHAVTGLLLADNEALLNLGHGPLRMTDIANRLVLSRGGTTKVIDRLEEFGYVERKPDPSDRRATMVEITEAGRDAWLAARRVIDTGLELSWARHLTDDEARVLIEVMDRIVAEHRGHGDDSQ